MEIVRSVAYNENNGLSSSINIIIAKLHEHTTSRKPVKNRLIYRQTTLSLKSGRALYILQSGSLHRKYVATSKGDIIRPNENMALARSFNLE